LRNPAGSRKGIATAIGAVFFILIVIVGFVTIWTINTYEARYQEVKTKMNDWDVQRISENIHIRSLENSTVAGYNLTLIVDNIGGVLVKTSRIYIYDQTDKSKLYLYDQRIGAGNGFVNGSIDVGEQYHKIEVKGTPLNELHTYRVILTTERGRQFSYVKEYKVSFQGPTLAYSSGSMKIKYATLTQWISPYIGSEQLWTALGAAEPQKLRVKATFMNTAGRSITIASGNILLQICDTPDNKKIFFLGGWMESGAGTYAPNQVFDVIWVIERHSFGNKSELESMLESYPNDRAIFLGSAAFSSAQGEPFYIAGILMDGLLVYLN